MRKLTPKEKAYVVSQFNADEAYDYLTGEVLPDDPDNEEESEAVSQAIVAMNREIVKAIKAILEKY